MYLLMLKIYVAAFLYPLLVLCNNKPIIVYYGYCYSNFFLLLFPFSLFVCLLLWNFYTTKDILNIVAVVVVVVLWKGIVVFRCFDCSLLVVVVGGGIKYLAHQRSCLISDRTVVISPLIMFKCLLPITAELYWSESVGLK